MNPVTKDHKEFEIMCALAVSGQVSPTELEDLKLHMAHCVDCRGRVRDFAQISAQALLVIGKGRRSRGAAKDVTSRFVERARAEGIPLKLNNTEARGVWRNSLGWTGSFAAALLTVVVVVGVAKITDSKLSRSHFTISTPNAAPMNPSGTEILALTKQSRPESRSLKYVSVGRPSPTLSEHPSMVNQKQLNLVRLSADVHSRRTPSQYSRAFGGKNTMSRHRFNVSSASSFDTFLQSAKKPDNRNDMMLSLASLREAPTAFHYRPDSSLANIFLGARSDNFHPRVDLCQLSLPSSQHPQRDLNNVSQCRSASFSSGWPTITTVEVERQ